MPRTGLLVSEIIKGARCRPSQWLRTAYSSLCLTVLTWAVISLIGCSVAWGAGTPMQAVKETIHEVLAVLEDEDLKGPAQNAERRKKLEAIIKQRFDYEEMAKRTLAAKWKKLNVEQQQEFVGLFQQFLTQSYAGNIDGYSGGHVEFVKERLKGDFAEVQTKLITPKVKIPLNYRLLKKHEKWGVYDVIIDGVSLTKNYRGQFSRIIKSSSFDALLDKLRSKTDPAASS